ncbi:hypothetical protein AXG53_04320 [Stenotrophomonas sp. KCTC 12332]|nr:hypothetical protein AXG53_04320 [Stenotrophomonas sp. KCTC 12332]
MREQAVVVDIGTGNGAIPLLAQSFAGSRTLQWQIHGIDIADIDPPGSAGAQTPSYGNIHFHPKTSMTKLPFAAGSVNLICSQFAFEYAPREQATREILRVLGAQGRAALVLHSHESVIHSVSCSQADACNWLLRESGIFDATRALLRRMAAANDSEARERLSADPHAEVARTGFNNVASRLMDRVEQSPDAKILQTLAQHLGQMLRHTWSSAEDADAAVMSLRSWTEDEHTRLKLMLAASLDRAALQETAGLLGASGLPVQTGKLLYQNSTVMGWTLVVGYE